MADHQHVEVLIQRVPRERHRRICGRRQDVGLAAQPDDVGGVAASGAFGVIGVNRPAADRGDGVLDEPGLVQRVGVDRHLHVELVGDRQTRVDGRRRRAPVLVKLQADRAGANLLAQRLGASTRCLCREIRNSTESPRPLRTSAGCSTRRGCRSSHWCLSRVRCRRRSASSSRSETRRESDSAK